MKKAFDEGWGGVIAKTISVDSSKVSLLTCLHKAAAMQQNAFRCSPCAAATGDQCDASLCTVEVQQREE